MGLTDYLAIYGAALSTAVAVWNYFRSRSRVRVILIEGLSTIDGNVEYGLYISIQNPSSQAAHISSVSLLYPFRPVTVRDCWTHILEFRRLPFRIGWCHTSLSNYGVEDGCPVSIEPGKSHQIFVKAETVERVLQDAQSRHLKAVSQDALWRDKYSKAFEWLAAPNDDEQIAVSDADAPSKS